MKKEVWLKVLLIIIGVAIVVVLLPFTKKFQDKTGNPVIEEKVLEVFYRDFPNIKKVKIVSFEEKIWPNACLGIPLPNEFCAQVLTEGFEVVLEFDDKTVTYRSNQTGSLVR